MNVARQAAVTSESCRGGVKGADLQRLYGLIRRFVGCCGPPPLGGGCDPKSRAPTSHPNLVLLLKSVAKRLDRLAPGKALVSEAKPGW